MLNECNLSYKIVKDCRIIGLNRAKNNKFYSESVVNKHGLIVLFTSDVMYKNRQKVQKAGLHATGFISEILYSKLLEHKNPAWFFIVASLLNSGGMQPIRYN